MKYKVNGLFSMKPEAKLQNSFRDSLMMTEKHILNLLPAQKPFFYSLFASTVQSVKNERITYQASRILDICAKT